MKNAKKITTIVLIAAMVLLTTTMLAACNETGQSYDPETRPFAMSISTPDGVFNPIFLNVGIRLFNRRYDSNRNAQHRFQGQHHLR